MNRQPLDSIIFAIGRPYDGVRRMSGGFNSRRLFHLLILVCAFASSSVTAFGALISQREYTLLAKRIYEMHDANRSDSEFMRQLLIFALELYTKGIEVEDNGGTRLEQTKLFILAYFTSKLAHQYALDNRKTVGDELFSQSLDMSRSMRATLTDANIPFSVVANELNDFRRPFANSAAFRLRSL